MAFCSSSLQHVQGATQVCGVPISESWCSLGVARLAAAATLRVSELNMLNSPRVLHGDRVFRRGESLGISALYPDVLEMISPKRTVPVLSMSTRDYKTSRRGQGQTFAGNICSTWLRTRAHHDFTTTAKGAAHKEPRDQLAVVSNSRPRERTSQGDRTLLCPCRCLYDDRMCLVCTALPAPIR